MGTGPTPRDPAHDTQPLPTPEPTEDHTEDPMDTTTRPEPDRPEAHETVSEAPNRGVRVGTVVWGLVLAAVGLGLLALSLGYSFDVELAFIVLVGAAGVALLVGSLLTAARRRT